MKNEVIICVDDEIVILNSLRSELSKHFSDYTIELAESAKEVLEVIEELKKDGHEILAIVSDYLMPEMNGDELLIQIHKKYPEIMKIMLTGQANVEGVGRAINEADLYRYLSKPWERDDLVMTIKQAIKSYKDTKCIAAYNKKLESEIKLKTYDLVMALEKLETQIKEKNVIQKKLVRIATIDPLTSIYNRRKFFSVGEKEFQHALQTQTNLHIIMIDLDHFKYVNDTYGHDTGDVVLKQFVKIVAKRIRFPEILFARIGGEEFLLLLKDKTNAEAMHIGQDIRELISSAPIEHKENRVNVSVSIGISSFNENDKTIDDLIARADTYLYCAKNNGRNMVIDAKSYSFLKDYLSNN
ncbi:diguanylate cyclase [Sulfurimonas sp. SAG-AH-194-I05]|nr:diguanylate cyclase [Sulfurimonas sp. SAG-AH-194-I05]MDF1875717.1 diguanylate cyclase [Sulfurimonas sp. SAG-AH-194-I05]